MNITETKNGILITVFVKSNSPKFQIDLDDAEIVARCTQEPVKGRVNKELIKEFTKLFHARVCLVSGLTSKQKQVFVEGLTKNEAQKLLSEAFGTDIG